MSDHQAACPFCPTKAVRCEGCPQITIAEAIAETPDAPEDIEAHEDAAPISIITRDDLP